MDDAEKVTLVFNENKVHLYKRPRSRYWQCSVLMDGQNHRTSTKQSNLALASAAAELWFLKHRLQQLLKAKGQTLLDVLDVNLVGHETGERPDRRKKPVHTGPKFPEVAELFLKEYPILTRGERSETYTKGITLRVRNVLIPYFKDKYITEIMEAEITGFREHRLNTRVPRFVNRPGLGAKPASDANKPISRSTLHKDIVVLRLILKTAKRHRLIDHLPDMSEPYSKSKKVKPRPWFSPAEYKELYEATRERAKNPKKERWRGESEDLHDLVLFAANTGLRPDELGRLQIRDVTIDDEDMGGTEILHIRVAQGKRGFGNCKSMPGAVEPYRRVLRRRNPAPHDLVFPNMHRELLNDVMTDTGLKTTRDGQNRSLYSLRHTYICMRLMEGADYYAVAKNCRTSPEMIERHYASHIKELINVADLNVQRPAATRRRTRKRQTPEA